VDPSAFRRDPWLRTSGYHLATWSLVAFVMELWRRQPESDHATATVVLVAGAVLTSLTNERRVAKMAGIAGEPVYPGTALVWRLVALALFVSGAAAVFEANTNGMFPVAMIATGMGFAVWGAGAGFAWFSALGAAMVGTALVDVALLGRGDASRTLRLAVLGVALPAFGLATSYRFLWFRPSGDRT
jgi:hypothetical protein